RPQHAMAAALCVRGGRGRGGWLGLLHPPNRRAAVVHRAEAFPAGRGPDHGGGVSRAWGFRYKPRVADAQQARSSVLDHRFGDGPPLTVGVEEEYMLL